MKCAVEHYLDLHETQEHEAMLQHEFLERSYEEAFEYCSDCDDNTFGRLFKDKLRGMGLTLSEIDECLDWLSDDKRMEWE